MLMVPADSMDTIQTPAHIMPREELVELVYLLKSERKDLHRKIQILEDTAQMWREATSSCEATVDSLGRLSDLQRVTCEAEVQLERSACRCPAKWMRRVTNGALFSVGVLAGRGACD